MRKYIILNRDVNFFLWQTVLNDVRRAQQTSMAASNEAQAAYDFANQAKELSMRELEEVTSLNGKIAEFTSKDRATPENVKEVAEQVRNFVENIIQYQLNKI